VRALAVLTVFFIVINNAKMFPKKTYILSLNATIYQSHQIGEQHEKYSEKRLGCCDGE